MSHPDGMVEVWKNQALRIKTEVLVPKKSDYLSDNPYSFGAFRNILGAGNLYLSLWGAPWVVHFDGDINLEEFIEDFVKYTEWLLKDLVAEKEAGWEKALDPMEKNAGACVFDKIREFKAEAQKKINESYLWYSLNYLRGYFSESYDERLKRIEYFFRTN